jgi:selenocysteine-specific translation elongation factor
MCKETDIEKYGRKISHLDEDRHPELNKRRTTVDTGLSKNQVSKGGQPLKTREVVPNA